MKKITFLVVVILLAINFNAVQAKTATMVPSYFVNETFTGASAYPTGWSTGTALYAANGGVSWTSPAANQLNVSGTGSGNRGFTINYPTSGSETSVYVNFDWYITSQAIGQKNSIGLILHGSGASSSDPKNILGLYNCGSGGFFYCWNLEKDSTTFLTGGTFNRASSVNAAGTSTRNAGSNTNFALATANWYNIKAKLNFSTHVIDSLIITKKSDNTNVVFTNLSFINSTANDIGEISCFGTKSSNAGNGGNSGYNFSIDNFQTYKLVDVATSSVTINYLGADNAAVKTASTVANQTVGSTYTALASDKATFTDGTYYYVYDTVNTTSDNVVIASDGSSVINLKFTKIPVTNGTYTWMGTSNGNWSDADANFTTDGTNAMPYQTNNAILFPSTATQKTIALNSNLNIGDQNIALSGNGYSISGNNSITGTGAFNLNLASGETATLGIKNNLTGGYNINGGTAVITNDLGTGAYTLADGANIKLQTGANFSKAINGTGTITIEAASNVYYTSAINGATTVNLILDNAGSGTSSTWSDYFGGKFPVNAQINVTTGLATAGFGVADTVLTNKKVNLGDGIRLLRWYNQASSSGGTSTIVVGELSGTATSTVEGGMVDAATRILAYQIGGLNTNATFAGTIKNYGSVTTAPLNIYKKGSGTWTLTGTNTYTPGIFNVDSGKVILNGSLSGDVPVTVATNATLAGTGSIAGTTIINGILEGSLSFAKDLSLNGTTNIIVNGFNTGDYNAINVTGTLNNGGTLNITVNASQPSINTSIQLLHAGTYAGSFTAVNLPANYSFDATTGTLTYTVATRLENAQNDNCQIYPTIAKSKVYVQGTVSEIKLMNIAGQTLQVIQPTSSNTAVDLSGNSDGIYFISTKLLNGTIKTQRIIVQK